MYKSKIIFISASIVFIISITIGVFWQNIILAPNPVLYGCNALYHMLDEEPPDLLNSISAEDYRGRDLTDSIVVNDQDVDWNSAGVYQLIYSVEDRYGKITEERVMLTIVPKYPYFEGLDDIYCEIGSVPDYLSAVKAYDGFGLSLYEKITVNTYECNINVLGEYPILYSVEDDYGFFIIEQVNLFIIQDFAPCFIYSNNVEYLIGTGSINYIEGVSAYDYRGQDITHLIDIDDSQVNLNEIGVYSVYLSVKDAEDNDRIVERNVIVRDYEEEDYPKINGIINHYINLGGSAPNWSLGISAYDQTDKDITDLIVIDISEVDINKIGVYYAYYSVTNSKGLEYNGVSRVEVHEPIVDITSPELIGERDITYSIGDSYPDYMEGVSAIDDFDGDISDLIIIDDSLVDYETLGEYQVTYSITDSSDNSKIVCINVMVVDTTPPVIYNAESMIYYIGDPPPDYITGVTARDNVDGYLTAYIEVDDSEVDYLTEGCYNVRYYVSDSSENMGEYIVIIEVICNQI